MPPGPASRPRTSSPVANGALWWPKKGQDLILETLAGEVCKNRPWRLTLYGKGPTRGILEALASRLDLSDRVNFAGFAAPEEIWSRNHILVLPSRFEGLPLVMVEAMLCGRPVIATDVAGHRELVEEGVAGFLASAPTASALGAALERFWERRDEAEHIGRAASRRIRQLVPPNPARVFSDRLLRLAGLAEPQAATPRACGGT